MGELFKILKTYQKGGSPKLIIDWVEVPRKVRIKLVKEVLPDEFIKKMEYLGLTDEVFNGHDYIPNEKTYKERLEHYLKLYPTFEEFIFESCHWKNVKYDVLFYKEQDTKKLYKDGFQYLYYAVFGEIFPVESYKIWSEKLENQNKFLSDFVREIKFGKNKYQKKDKIETIIDIDGNVYKTVQIGNQIWMAENLRVSRYSNGDVIPNIIENKVWFDLNCGAWCNYDNNSDFDSEYGKLYNWFTIDDKRGLAPKGWHVPSIEEWNMLIDNLGGKEIAGGKLKEFGTEHWEVSNEEATNESGFSALPGGYRGIFSTFDGKSHYGSWWSSIDDRSSKAWSSYLSYQNKSISISCDYKQIGLTVRCIKDAEEYILNQSYDSFEMFCDGNSDDLRDFKNKMITQNEYDEVDSYIGGIAKVKRNGFWGCIDENRTEIIPIEFSYIYDFVDGKAKVAMTNEYNLSYEDKETGGSYGGTQTETLYGYIDLKGEKIISIIYNFIYEFIDGVAIAEKEIWFKHEVCNLFGVIDENENIVIPFEYNTIQKFVNGNAYAQKNGKWGLIDQSGNEIIPLKYNTINELKEAHDNIQ